MANTKTKLTTESKRDEGTPPDSEAPPDAIQAASAARASYGVVPPTTRRARSD